MNISIEHVSSDDLPEVAELYKELSGRCTNITKMRCSFNWMQSNPDYIVLGARDQGYLAATLLAVICHDILGDCRPFMVIENVIVSSRYRRQGIGTNLMRSIEEVAAERDCLYIMFVSSSARTDAHQFYEAIGYKSDFVQGFKKYL